MAQMPVRGCLEAVTDSDSLLPFHLAQVSFIGEDIMELAHVLRTSILMLQAPAVQVMQRRYEMILLIKRMIWHVTQGMPKPKVNIA